MEILKDAGTFEVLTKPEDVISQIARAAETCYQSQDKASPERDIKMVKSLIKRRHMAMIEFADMTVRFDLISRGFTHEDVRHRLCSFAQKSTRYVDESEFQVVVPPHHDIDEQFDVSHEGTLSLRQWFQMNEEMYRALRKNGYKPEDARQVLPIAIKSQIVQKANLREWRHIFKMRCDKFAHWEIRGVMLRLLTWCKDNIPVIFDDFHFFVDDGKQYAAQVLPASMLRRYIREYQWAGGVLDNLLSDLKTEG